MRLLELFHRADGGNVAVVFALAAIPLLGATGAAVDFTTAYEQRTIVQDAIDAASLAANRKIGTSTTAQIQAEANNFYLANVAGHVPAPPPITTTIVNGTVTVTATLTVPTTFLAMAGMSSIQFDLQSVSTSNMGTIELAMVLDNSGSMAGTKISTLRTSAVNLTETLFTLSAASILPTPLQISVVPFAAAVNVGSQYATAAWIDTQGLSPVAGQNFDLTSGKPTTPLSLFKVLKNAPWGGCVEVRPQPYDVTDDTPTTTNPATLYEPMFAPDEPDDWNSGNYNNYLSDKGGTCAGNTPTTTSANEPAAQSRTCKYQGASVQSINPMGIPGGPNFMCTSQAMLPMSTSKATIESSVNAMQAIGATNLLQGFTWGWNTISPNGPFKTGRPYGTQNNTKIIILETDGVNTYYPNGTFDVSTYGAFSYIAHNNDPSPKLRLGTVSSNQSTEQNAMNTRVKLACANAKAQGIIIYAVGFEITATDIASGALDVLQTCASTADKYYSSSSSADLIAAFQAIGNDISQLRIAK